MFFLGSEIDIDDLSGEGCPSSEYWEQTKDSWLSIRVGTTKDNKGKLRAKITFGGNSQDIKGIDLKDCPTMRTE